ncbi:MAG: hypothetical protein IIC67_00305 [Thaumarchaeota archaeon]|nr:hypothetical protein [Nitrososphaerota archaeon]
MKNVDPHVKNVCQPGTNSCCAYLVMGSTGWECAKMSKLRFNIDLRLAEGTMRATGDNCEGVELKT